MTVKRNNRLSACGSAVVENSSSTAATTTVSQTTEEQTSEVATDTETTETTASAEESDSDTAESAAEETESSGKVLVVYYSATGSTERAANAIAEATGGDLFTTEAKRWMDKYEVQIEAWAPFGEGRGNLFTNEILTKIGEKHQKSAAQVMLRWNLQRGVVVGMKMWIRYEMILVTITHRFTLWTLIF